MKLANNVVLGIDPGYDRMGWSIVTGEKGKYTCIALGCVQTNKNDDIFVRFDNIQKDLNEIIDYFKPNILAIETIYFAKNKKTALRVSEVKGIIIGTCLNKNLQVFEYDPVTIKLAITGNGKADKQAIKKMVKLQIKDSMNKFIDDAVDAVAIGITHCVSAK